MIRQGKVCKGCTNQCHELPTEMEPLEIECPTCHGNGCGYCDDGWVKITECPQQVCSGIAPTLDLIDLFHKGMAPVAGGVLDQSQWFINAAKQLRDDEAAMRAT